MGTQQKMIGYSTNPHWYPILLVTQAAGSAGVDAGFQAWRGPQPRLGRVQSMGKRGNHHALGLMSHFSFRR